jgi:hypothetical protein
MTKSRLSALRICRPVLSGGGIDGFDSPHPKSLSHRRGTFYCHPAQWADESKKARRANFYTVNTV